MSQTKEQIAEALKSAIRAEEEGFNFYNMMAAKATNPEAKQKLERLRNDEARHKATLIDLYTNFVGGEIGSLPENGTTPLSEAFQNDELTNMKSEMQFIDLAIKTELSASKFYAKESELVDEQELKDIFKMLSEEEYIHFEVLQAERDALTGNYSWFGSIGDSSREH